MNQHATPADWQTGQPQASANAKVAILLCTYNGGRFLREQLDSYATQTWPNWEVWASDDGSTDNTHPILEHYRERWGPDKLSIHSGPGKGFVANFLNAACHTTVHADYYAFSDQDDVWEADKLARAVAWLDTVPNDTPAIYCSRTRIVDTHNRDIGLSPLFSKPPGFANALMQVIGGGNTMVFNNAARELLCLTGPWVQVLTHDWWLYLLVTGCGGVVRYDAVPTLRYRQHGANLVGSNVKFKAVWNRIGLLWSGKFKEVNDQHIVALQHVGSRLTEKNKITLEIFRKTRQGGVLYRAAGAMQAGLYRQTLLGNLGIAVAVLFKKI